MNEFEKYYEMSEKTSWRITDLNWNKIDKENISEFDRQVVLATSVIEHGVPHYSDTWFRVKGIEKEWELWQFATLWAGEEHRHSYALKKLAEILDVRGSSEDYDIPNERDYYYKQVAEGQFGKLHKESCPTDCYSTIGGMLTYTTIQELVTAKYYQSAYKKTKSKFLKQLLDYIAKDEFKHHAFYGAAIKRYYEKAENKEKYLEDVYNAVIHFSMPHSIYNAKFAFFDNKNMFSKLDHIEIKLRIGKLLAFSKALLKKLAINKNYQDALESEKAENLIAV